jgi:hypothetical protein
MQRSGQAWRVAERPASEHLMQSQRRAVPSVRMAFTVRIGYAKDLDVQSQLGQGLA